MKKSYAVFVVLLLSLTGLSAAALQKIPAPDPNPGNLRIYCYVPEELDSGGRYPLLLVLHGSMLNAGTTHRCGGWAVIADSMKLLVLYPEQRFLNNPVRAFNVLFGVRKSRLQKEAEFIRDMIAMMVERYAADPERVYVTDLSAGGSMANALLHIYPELFKAGALIAAPAYLPREIIRDMPHIPRFALSGRTRSGGHTGQRHRDFAGMAWKIPAGYPGARNGIPLFEQSQSAGAVFFHEDRPVIIRLDMAGVGHQMPVDPGPALPRGGWHSLYSVDIDFYLKWWIAGFFLSE